MIGNEVTIPLDGVALSGELIYPSSSCGLVLFAHGSGSSRYSSRNQYVARVLRDAGLGTLLFDLMTADEAEAEAHTRHLRFDIPFLAGRLVGATRWVLNQGRSPSMNIGYFGSSTGAAAALVAAAELGDTIGAVVSRGGRVDLANRALDHVRAPTLLLVGGKDGPVIPLNEEAHHRLRCEKLIQIIAGASHLFEEAGTLERVAALASEWFSKHLSTQQDFA